MADKYYPVRFVVEGSGRFPMDMLRYDRCCPFDESDSGRTEASGLRQIKMIKFAPDSSGGMPNAQRWASFGWYIRSVEGTRQ